jgi:ABC-2 type transport system permease protein
LLHALPIGRRAVWLGRWVASMLMVATVSIICGVATLACLPVFSLTEVPMSRIVGATAGCALLAAFHGSIVYTAAGAGASRGLAAGIGILVLVVGYLTSFVLPIAKSLSGARRWSPWYWALGDQPVTNGVHPGWMLLVGALTAVLVAAGTEAIDRRDIRTA